MSAETFDAVTVGAGIGGTAFALAAGREGWRVAVVEKEPAPRPLPRAEVLWPASLRFLDALGVGEDTREDAAVRLRGLELWNADAGKPMLRLREREFTAAGVQPYATDPAATRAALLAAAVDTGNVTHLSGTRATGLHRVGERVAGVTAERDGEPVTYHAPLVIADDGAGSVVREAAGIPIAVSRFPVEFIITTGPRPSSLPPGEGRAFLHPKGFAEDVVGGLFMPVGRERVALVILGRHGAFGHHEVAPPGEFEELAAWSIPMYAEFGEAHAFPRDFVKAVRPVGHARAYWRPGVVLMGDAAHPVSPVGGQGANMALADAAALGRILFPRSERGRAPNPGVLAAYEAVRRPGNARSVGVSERAGRTINGLWRYPASARLLPFVMRRVDRSRARKAKLVRAMARAFIEG